MSRVRVFGRDNQAVGEFTALTTRGYGLSGASNLQGGMAARILLTDAVAQQDWIQLGRMVYIEDEEGRLPPWAGVIDTPWSATLPVEMTVYSAEYLMQLRSPDKDEVIKRTFESVLARLIELVNAEEDLYVRMGETTDMPAGAQQLTIQQKPLWGQINDFGKREGVEYCMRPTYRRGEPLLVYVDASGNFGERTGMQLTDGEGGNMALTKAEVAGKIVNRAIGIGRSDTAGSRLATAPYMDDESVRRYGLRSAVQQFRTLTIQSSLNSATQKFLDQSKRPRLYLEAEIRDASLFPHIRLGNWWDVHAANIYLPGGRRGWRGQMRMTQFVYDEGRGVVTAGFGAVISEQ
ncbi:MAG: hypothetical protein LC130_17000 [Bryobacterales bacterium]|nr:hypothetical protein [Bryobacterales bacterium]